MKDFNMSLLIPLLANAQKRAVSMKEFNRIFKESCKKAGFNFKQVKEYLESSNPPEGNPYN